MSTLKVLLDDFRSALSMGPTNLPIADAAAVLRKLMGEDFIVRSEQVLNGDDSGNDNDTGARILITAKHGTRGKLAKQCGGVVIEYPSCEVISLPAPVVMTGRDIPNLRRLRISEYDIYEIRDGTVVTLYWQGEWKISSMNAFDVSDYKWIGDATYREIITEIMTTMGWSFDSLLPNLAYTIGFRHHNAHPLLTDPAGAWLIQVSDGMKVVANGANPHMEVANLPWQKPISTAEMYGKNGPLAWMQSRNENALSDYATSVHSGAPEICYGYLFRHKTQPDFILESTLLTFIRQTVYNLPKDKAHLREVSAKNRMNYVILRAYLSYEHRYNFRALFPQFGEQNKKLDAFFSNLIRLISHRLRGADVIPKAAGSPEEKLDAVVARLVKDIKDFAPVNSMDANGADIIRDLIVQPNYTDLYHSIAFD